MDLGCSWGSGLVGFCHFFLPMMRFSMPWATFSSISSFPTCTSLLWTSSDGGGHTTCEKERKQREGWWWLTAALALLHLQDLKKYLVLVVWIFLFVCLLVCFHCEGGTVEPLLSKTKWLRLPKVFLPHRSVPSKNKIYKWYLNHFVFNRNLF